MKIRSNISRKLAVTLMALAPFALSAAEARSQAPVDPPRIQLAILLDTSNSMDGLIDQTRNQLWQVVNEFASARRDGMTPILEIALFEYGNDGVASAAGHVRMRTGFTRELDRVSEALFSLTTNGGNEYCGYAIQSAVDSLQWSRSDADIKTIFIAGNEAFTQGPVRFNDAILAAGRAGISVNTIHAGGYEEGVNGGWKAGAVLAGGDYMSIDANRQVVHVQAPQDEEIARLNAELNQTYVPYGEQGAASAARQLQQDDRSNQISSALLAKRAQAKASIYYNNSAWDLVDAFTEGAIAEAEVMAMAPESLPAEISQLEHAEKLDYLKEKAGRRKDIQQRISTLAAERASFVSEKQREAADVAPSIGDALGQVVKKEAARKHFVLER